MTAALCAAFWSAASPAASCSYTNFSIGFEISAQQGPNTSGQYLFAVSPLRCNGTGQVIYDSGTGFSDAYEMGWYTPSAIRAALRTSFLSNLKTFEGWCRLHYVGINSRYHGNVSGINADAYALQATPYLRVFANELHLPLGAGPRLNRRDAIADPSTNLCNPPAQVKETQCSVGNPIAPGQGCKLQKESDYSAAGASPLDFVRYYDSRNPYHYLAALPRPLGNRWRHNHDVSLNPVAAPNLVVMLRAENSILHFHPQPGHPGEWVADADIVGQLRQTTSGWTWRGADDALETFDRSGKRLTRTWADGRALHYRYDAADRLSEIRDDFERKLELSYDTAGRLSVLTDPAGQRFIYGYDSEGTLASVGYPDQSERRYHYTSVSVDGKLEPALLAALSDENGTPGAAPYATWTYDSSALANSSEHAGGVEHYAITYQKDSHDKISGATLVNPLNAVSQYAFQEILGAHKISSLSHPLLPGVARTFSYDANGNLTAQSDFNGNITTTTWDFARNLPIRRSEAVGRPELRTVSTQWHPLWRWPVKIAEPGKISTWTYNGDILDGSIVRCAPDAVALPGQAELARGVVCRKTEQTSDDATGSSSLAAMATGPARIWIFTYDRFGQLLSTDGPRTDLADITTYSYYDADDADPGRRGNLSRITNALGQVTRITAYDAHGNPLALIDPNGILTTLGYDARQRLTSRSVDGETTTYDYDRVGQLTRITLPDASTHYRYDAAHRLISVADGLGNRIDYRLDALGNRIQEEVRDPANQLAQTRQRIYDPLGRLAQDIGARGQITAYAYDANGNRTRRTDPLNHHTRFAFDALDRLIQETDPGLGQTRYAYNGQDHLIQVTDPRNLATTYRVDGLGNRPRQQSPDSGLTTSTYDAAGNEITRSDARGQTTRIAYDALNRPIRIDFQDGSQRLYRWDQGTNGIGRLTQIDDYQASVLTGSVQTSYDAQGRIVTQAHRVGEVSQTVSWVWEAGQIAAMTTPSGRRIGYRRDGAGRISAVSLSDLSGETRVIASAIDYHPFGGIKSYLDGAGQWHRRSIDQDGRIDSYTLASQSWLLSRDAAGRIAAQFDAGNAASSVTYGYNDQDRLTSANLPNTLYGYTWDATGNRSSHTLGNTTRSYRIDPASNRLQSVGSVPPRTYVHDANGSITSDGSNRYAYDGKGRLSQASTAAGNTRYQYNGLGERVRKASNAVSTIYLYDPAGHLIAESAPDGTIQREYLWLDDLPLAVLQ
ncbi:MAG: DUF6531 domain-containing protein [Candidatus Accumulibacter sp. UW26]